MCCGVPTLFLCLFLIRVVSSPPACGQSLTLKVLHGAGLNGAQLSSQLRICSICAPTLRVFYNPPHPASVPYPVAFSLSVWGGHTTPPIDAHIILCLSMVLELSAVTFLPEVGGVGVGGCAPTFGGWRVALICCVIALFLPMR